MELEKGFKNNQNFQWLHWSGFESKLSLEYFDVGFRDYTDIVMEI